MRVTVVSFVLDDETTVHIAVKRVGNSNIRHITRRQKAFDDVPVRRYRKVKLRRHARAINAFALLPPLKPPP